MADGEAFVAEESEPLLESVFGELSVFGLEFELSSDFSVEVSDFALRDWLSARVSVM